MDPDHWDNLGSSISGNLRFNDEDFDDDDDVADNWEDFVSASAIDRMQGSKHVVQQTDGESKLAILTFGSDFRAPRVIFKDQYTWTLNSCETPALVQDNELNLKDEIPVLLVDWTSWDKTVDHLTDPDTILRKQSSLAEQFGDTGRFGSLFDQGVLIHTTDVLLHREQAACISRNPTHLITPFNYPPEVLESWKALFRELPTGNDRRGPFRDVLAMTNREWEWKQQMWTELNSLSLNVELIDKILAMILGRLPRFFASEIARRWCAYDAGNTDAGYYECLSRLHSHLQSLWIPEP